MNDLISREELKTALISCHDLGRKSCEAVIKVIEEQPTIEATKEKRNKIVDEFAEEMKRYIAVEYGLTDISLKEIEKIVERMKGE